MSNVQVPERLLLELYAFHNLNRRAPLCDEEYIRTELAKKFEAWKRRTDYAADLDRKRSEHVVPDSHI